MRALRLAVALTALSAGCRSERVQPIAETVARPTVGAAALPAEAVGVDPEAEKALRDYVVRSHHDGGPDPAASPERFAAAMKGVVPCGKKKSCRAGKEVCVVAPVPGYEPRCEPIASWIDHRTPRPQGGFPGMAGITACAGSHNCPPDTVCCLHEIGSAEVQAIVCHASLAECRDKRELCELGAPGGCRTPGTRCVDDRCEGP